MAISVDKIFAIDGDELVTEFTPPPGHTFSLGSVVSCLLNLPACPDAPHPGFRVEIIVGEGGTAREVTVPLQPFIGLEAHNESALTPVSLLEQFEWQDGLLRRWLWLYRSAIWLTSRQPRNAEIAEVILRIKAAQFKVDGEFQRLREQVANFEAIETMRTGGRIRTAIPDDVKLLVWSRDGGACIKCSSTDELQFDHVIPHSRGGSATEANIQLLCRRCNQTKANGLI
ncbi:MAG: HNH endonuclease [Vicinamibacterales bacterium]